VSCVSIGKKQSGKRKAVDGAKPNEERASVSSEAREGNGRSGVRGAGVDWGDVGDLGSFSSEEEGQADDATQPSNQRQNEAGRGWPSHGSAAAMQ